VRAATLLKQVSANATEAATEDQASDHTHQTDPKRAEFELNITEDPPTADQLQTILEYVGVKKVGSVINGANSVQEALKKFKESPDSFKRPVVCSHCS
jgi:arsenate reductase-like glutaredoxin family protein